LFCIRIGRVSIKFGLVDFFRLICTITYNVPSSAVGNEPVVLERFFKFQVKKPLDVKTKLYNAEVRISLEM